MSNRIINRITDNINDYIEYQNWKRIILGLTFYIDKTLKISSEINHSNRCISYGSKKSYYF